MEITYQYPDQPIVFDVIWINQSRKNKVEKRLNFYLMLLCLHWNVSPNFSVHSSSDTSPKLNVSHSNETSSS